tara:strand:- start:272 stop:556 length:285 start_codon:yes stop_codon:yes gene_type:complete
MEYEKKRKWFRPIIEKEIPLPKEKESFSSYHDTWKSMEVGDSILFPSEIKWSIFKRQAGLFAMDHNYLRSGLRVWKITDAETVRYYQKQRRSNK